MIWDLLTHPSNIVFSIALMLCLFIGLLELILLLLGGSSSFLEQFLPDSLTNVDHADVSLEQSDHFLTQLLEWLYLGKVPLLIWLIIFLTVYALTGLILQDVFYQLTGQYLSAWIIAPACLFLCMPLVRYSAALIAKIIPKDETTAIQTDDLIGRTAHIILGDAKPNSPAQAKVKDQFGQTHYVLVEPELDIVFHQGQQVILTQRTKIGFQAVAS
ncbi:YqiJ family protein [Acinetobacter dispersus]|uniref:YqiJ family protein n=1 Tax=Acinetobacter dispersus TaxID=70348 RepID=UPI001F4B8F7A|nr:YqiJ family protein [Acinetobacter dispersus]MCH7385506.1 YqiJ family protein [Acinetobacter dispersus]MCH7390411.1 YqiJ family protein [Acinetobacter dispersus]MCU4338429.1 YqiJ family protein [Acinetobacter dispersus]